MAERDDVPEGWSVRHRPALVAALATPLVLTVLLAIAGWLYCERLRPVVRQPVTAFPAPGLETFVHDGVADPYRPSRHTRPDPTIAAAKRSVVDGGIRDWQGRP
ncbi:hypothetical protein SAMN05192583_0680 [Sphingomonas gellani]|uniref:Uncharacterized protein n=1 Tax=Sphingomonas gellani TaxID=1166340 RepID=A0A1H7ZG39_9SPHN|nr:hypothetical protein [Sphingomonas gellani]SEM57245.1 hypothetical protein SAMN05192583_0680 [Sphingomonas gellani]